MKYKMIVADFDWTLGLAPNFIAPSTVETIKEYQKMGGEFVICSGRKLESIEDICNMYDLKCDIVGYQGALIKDKFKKELFSAGISKSVAKSIIESLINDNLTVLVYFDDKLNLSKKDSFTDLYEKWTTSNGEVFTDVQNKIKTSKIIRKVMCMCDPKYASEVIERYSQKFNKGLTINSGAPGLVEFVSNKYTKGKAVNYLAKYYSIPISEVLTIGDSLNDYSLITAGGHGVAVGNACEELKKVANEITVPFEKNPVEKIIKKYW